jgi:hypothetical protein
MPSAALLAWHNDRQSRLREVETHCLAVQGQIPQNLTFLDETLRGYVLHLSAHFQGFCRDLYSECCQICIGMIPAQLQPVAQAQFSKHLALEKGNPTYATIRTDFERFGFRLDVHAVSPQAVHQLMDLGHLNSWRNKAAHQGTKPLVTGVPTALTVALVHKWMVSCDGLAISLDGIMRSEFLRMTGFSPW